VASAPHHTANPLTHCFAIDFEEGTTWRNKHMLAMWVEKYSFCDQTNWMADQTPDLAVHYIVRSICASLAGVDIHALIFTGRSFLLK
jgi:hypothetical protein